MQGLGKPLLDDSTLQERSLDDEEAEDDVSASRNANMWRRVKEYMVSDMAAPPNLGGVLGPLENEECKQVTSR